MPKTNAKKKRMEFGTLTPPPIDDLQAWGEILPDQLAPFEPGMLVQRLDECLESSKRTPDDVPEMGSIGRPIFLHVIDLFWTFLEDEVPSSTRHREQVLEEVVERLTTGLVGRAPEVVVDPDGTERLRRDGRIERLRTDFAAAIVSTIGHNRQEKRRAVRRPDLILNAGPAGTWLARTAVDGEAVAMRYLEIDERQALLASIPDPRRRCAVAWALDGRSYASMTEALNVTDPETVSRWVREEIVRRPEFVKLLDRGETP